MVRGDDRRVKGVVGTGNLKDNDIIVQELLKTVTN